MNNTTEPQLNSMSDFTFLEAQAFKLEGPIKIFYINGTDEEACKAELIFDAGYKYQSKAIQAAAANQLLIEGSANQSSAQIAEFIDQMGAFLDTSLHADYASVQLHCLNKQFAELFEYLLNLIEEASFPFSEFEDFIQLKKQKFAVNQEKVSFQAKNHFLEVLLGEKHAYNNGIKLEQFEVLKHEDVIDFYQKYYFQQPFTILLSGKIEDSLLQTVEKLLVGKSWRARQSYAAIQIQSMGESELFIEKAKASQSAIRFGKQMPAKSHPDFPLIYLANLILGGYFGSRLMSNLREDKGYTYGIGSGLVNMQEVNYWFLSTEVGAEVTPLAIQEIEKELRKLSNELISEEELDLVKQYFQGSILRNFDGAFAAMDRFKSLYVLDLDYEYYHQMLSKIKNVQALDLISIFKKYYTFEDMSQIVVGKTQ